MTEPSGRSIARNAFHLLVGQVLTTALSIAFHSVMGRSLGAAEFGVLFLVTSWTAFVADITAWGVGNLLVTQVAKEPGQAGPLLGSALLFRLGATCVVLGPAVLLIRALGYDTTTQGLFALAIVSSIPLSLATLYGWVMRGHERMGRDAAVTVVAKALSLALVLPVLLRGGGVAAVLLAQSVGGAGGLALAVWQRRKLAQPAIRVEWKIMVRIAVVGVPIVVLSLQVGAQAFLESLLISKLAPAEVVGWYAAAKTFLGLLATPAAIIASASFPRLARAAHDVKAIAGELRTVKRPVLLLGAMGSVGTYLFADLAVSVVYGQKGFGPAATVVQVFGIGLILVFVDSVVSYALLAVERTRQLAVGKLVSIGAGVLVSWFAIPACQARFGNGAIGSALGFVVAEIFMVSAGVVVMPRGILGREDAIDLGRALLAGLLTIAAVKAVPAISPVIGIPASILVFTLASAGVGLLRSSDLGLVRRVLGMSGQRPRER